MISEINFGKSLHWFRVNNTPFALSTILRAITGEYPNLGTTITNFTSFSFNLSNSFKLLSKSKTSASVRRILILYLLRAFFSNWRLAHCNADWTHVPPIACISNNSSTIFSNSTSSSRSLSLWVFDSKKVKAISSGLKAYISIVAHRAI